MNSYLPQNTSIAFIVSMKSSIVNLNLSDQVRFLGIQLVMRSIYFHIPSDILKGPLSRIGQEKLVLGFNYHPCRVLEMKKNEPRPTLGVL